MEQKLLIRYISGDATPTEKKQVLEWVKTDSKNMSELLALRKLYDITLWQQTDTKATTQPERISRQLLFYKIASIAAVFLLLSGISLYLLFPKTELPEIVMQTIHVPAGQRAEVILADETSVWLNAGTTFTFPNNFSPGKREVTLDGEGYFHVKKQANQPFIVKTPLHDIHVTGTEFDVLAYGKSSLFEVAVVEGSVEVTSGNTLERIFLEAHTRTYKKNGKLIKDKIWNYDYLLWKDGIICFDDEPVDEIINKLELYYDIRIVLENDSFRNKKYIGKFRTKNGIEHILKVFQLKHKFTYEKDEELNVITIR